MKELLYLKDEQIKEFIENLQREKLSRERGLELQRGDVTNVNRNIT